MFLATKAWPEKHQWQFARPAAEGTWAKTWRGFGSFLKHRQLWKQVWWQGCNVHIFWDQLALGQQPLPRSTIYTPQKALDWALAWSKNDSLWGINQIGSERKRIDRHQRTWSGKAFEVSLDGPPSQRHLTTFSEGALYVAQRRVSELESNAPERLGAKRTLVFRWGSKGFCCFGV